MSTLRNCLRYVNYLPECTVIIVRSKSAAMTRTPPLCAASASASQGSCEAKALRRSSLSRAPRALLFECPSDAMDDATRRKWRRGTSQPERLVHFSERPTGLSMCTGTVGRDWPVLALLEEEAGSVNVTEGRCKPEQVFGDDTLGCSHSFVKQSLAAECSFGIVMCLTYAFSLPSLFKAWHGNSGPRHGCASAAASHVTAGQQEGQSSAWIRCYEWEFAERTQRRCVPSQVAAGAPPTHMRRLPQST